MQASRSERIRADIVNLATDIDQLKHYPGNPRQGDIGAISASLQAHGQYRPIVVRRGDNTILAGNHTVAAARALGWTQIAATFLDVSDEDAARIVIVDNRTNDLAATDSNALAALLQELAATPASLAGTGYDGDALDELLADLGQPAGDLPAFKDLDESMADDLPTEVCEQCGRLCMKQT